MNYRTGNFARIDEVISSVEAVDQWDQARSSEATYMYQLRAAQSVNVYEPFSPEQSALNDYLSRRKAGLRLCDYAWRLYAQSSRPFETKD